MEVSLDILYLGPTLQLVHLLGYMKQSAGKWVVLWAEKIKLWLFLV